MGSVMMSGVAPDMAVPASEIIANKIAVGSVVKLMEDGVATEYLVVNHGKPSGSSLYDDSCNGLWLIRKNCHSNHVLDSSDNDYKNSDIHAWLNGDFFNLFGSIEQSAIKQVKIPYVNGTGKSSISSGINGLSTKIFLLSGYEAGFTTSVDPWMPTDGAKLDYFISGNDSTAQQKRIATLNGQAFHWWLRSPYYYPNETELNWCVGNSGAPVASTLEYSWGIRPALIIPSTASFDRKTLILKGVA